MKPFAQKKTLAKKKALALSPVGLALAACGGGGGGETSSSTMAVAVEFPLTGNNFIDASTQGSKWSTSNGPLTYAVANGCLGPLKLCHYLLTKGVTENGTETVFG